MRTVDFIDIDASLKVHVTIMQQSKDGQPLKFQKCMIFSHHHDKKFEIEVRYSHGSLQESAFVTYERRCVAGRQSRSEQLATAHLLQ